MQVPNMSACLIHWKSIDQGISVVDKDLNLVGPGNKTHMSDLFDYQIPLFYRLPPI